MFLEDYDGVIVGGSIHKASIRITLSTSSELTVSAPSASVSVLFGELGCARRHGDAEAYVANFEQQTGWRPTKVGLFSGSAALPRQ